MTGDRADMLNRLRALLPGRWFPDSAPVLDAVLAGFASVWALAYEQLGFVRRQARIATADGAFLDLAALDFFGARLRRRVGQDDAALRAAIRRELLRVRATRPALQALLEELTGRTPLIFEPARPADTKAWGIASGWGVAGGWGSLDMPFQCLVTAFRPQGGGLSAVAGWGDAAGAWGKGAIQYASLSMMTSRASDAEITAAVADAMPACAIAWMRISN